MSNYNTQLQSNNVDLQKVLQTLQNKAAGGSGTDTSDATATAGDILSGKTAYVDGEKITGTIPSKSASNLTESGGTVTVPAGYYAAQATKSVATATQATPSITVSSAGLITASSSQSAGYVASGTKSATKQLTTQAAKTVTPTTSNQTAVASGVYTTGAITVKGDANLKAENIAEGVSIFGVTGTHAGGGGSGGGSVETCTVTVIITSSSYYAPADMSTIPCYWINIDNDGAIKNFSGVPTSSGARLARVHTVTITFNCVCNSLVYFNLCQMGIGGGSSIIIDGDSELISSTVGVLIFTTPSTSGNHTITITANPS